jgi:predicted nucleic acid-binding Zn ribbon protein
MLCQVDGLRLAQARRPGRALQKIEGIMKLCGLCSMYWNSGAVTWLGVGHEVLKRKRQRMPRFTINLPLFLVEGVVIFVVLKVPSFAWHWCVVNSTRWMLRSSPE